MARNWDTKWRDLCQAQHEAFKEFQEAQAELTAILGQQGAPPIEQLERDDGSSLSVGADTASA